MLRLGNRSFADDHLLIMAIINRTPDSFFDRGATFADAEALAAVDRAVAEGADIIDVGGVKAGPGDPVDTQEELRRTVAFVSQVRKAHPEVVISVDTWRAEVGRAVCEEGADLLNDAWEGHDPRLAEVAGEYGVGLVCTHAGGQVPRTRPHRVEYRDVVADIVATLQAKHGREVKVAVHVDPELIGGIAIRIGDEVTDVSVRGKLAQLAGALKV